MKFECSKAERASPFPTKAGAKGKLNFVYKNWCEKLNFNVIKKRERKRMKKLKIFLTMTAVVFSVMLCCSVNVFALTEGDWEFQLLDNEVNITGYNGSGGDVVVPETIYGRPVTKANFNHYRSGEHIGKVVSIKFPGSIKVIEDISYCRNLKTVVLSEGTEKLSSDAFYQCDSLENINFPSTLKVVGKEAFKGCEKLKDIDFPEGLAEINSSAFNNTGLTNVDLSKTSAKIGSGAFYGCENLKKARLPENMTEIPSLIFYECTSLSDIEIPANVEKIGNGAFDACKSLESIILPTSVKKIDDAFCGCEKLKEVVVPYGTTTIRQAFRSCPNLKAVYIPDTVTDLDSYVLSNSKNAVIYCTADSYAAKFCKKYKISYLTDNSVNSEITVLYNGTRISFHEYGQNPDLLNSRTLVPLRSIFETMGADVQWDASTNTVTAKRGKSEIKIQIGAGEMIKNGQNIAVDVPAQLVNNRTMVPVRVIAEAFGADVQWNNGGKTVLINE